MKTVLSLVGVALASVCLADPATYERASRQGLRELQRGDYAAAVPQLEAAVRAAEPFDESDARFAAAMANLARGYFLQGRYRAAEVLHRRVLAATEKRLPAEHPEVATALSNLAELYRYLGRIEEAAPLHRRALKIRERIYGAEDLSVAESLHQLAELLRMQRRYAEAEKLYWRAVMIRSYLQGKEHPALSPSLTGLAAVNKALGREAPARELYQRAAALAEKALPSSYPRSRLHDFAGGDTETVALARGNSASLQLMPASSLSEREGLAASQNPELARQLEGLAEIYAAQGRFAAALELLRRVLTMREGALGALHPEVGEAYGGLARILASLGQPEAALTAARAATRQLGTQAEKRRWEGVFLQHITLLAERSDAGALAESFATMQHLARLPLTLELAEAQKLLRSNEALLAYAVADDALYAWIVRPRDAVLLREITEERLHARAVPHLVGTRALLLVPHGGRHGVRPGLLARSHALTVLPAVGALAAR
jgi:tetratricopeptide (TPR) repeat protein